MEKVLSEKIGRYEIVKVLGQGRRGEVILAYDKKLSRGVVIRKPDPGGHDRFRFEAKAASLRHPSIPIVYEIGMHEDQPFVAMECVEGETLKHIIESKRELDLITRLKVVEQVCSALAYAHEKGVLHLQVTPSNIIIQPDGTAKLLDFGVALREDGEPHSGQPIRPRTKSLRIGRVDGSADIAAAGVVLFNLITSTDPFAAGSTPFSTAQPHTGLDMLLLEHLPALDQIVARSLAANPHDRFQTCEDFADAVRDIIKALKRARVGEMVHEAERLKSEGRLGPALAVLDQAVRFDPSNPPARKLRKAIRDEQERFRRAERLREHLKMSEEAVLNGKFDDALHDLRDALTLDPSSAEIKTRIEAVEEKKHRVEMSARNLAAAEEVKMRGDGAGALQLIASALEKDPDNLKLQTVKSALLQLLELEAQRSRLIELHEKAARALVVGDYDTAEKLLSEAEMIDPSNPETLKQSGKLAKARELEQSRATLQDIEQRIHDLIRTDAHEEARNLIDQALEKFPGEPLLHRLKAQVQAEASAHDVRHIVDLTIAEANELASSSPLDALKIVANMLDNIPGEERLVALERALRRQINTT